MSHRHKRANYYRYSGQNSNRARAGYSRISQISRIRVFYIKKKLDISVEMLTLQQMEKQRIKNIRKRLGWSQTELGKYMGVSRSSVAQWEIGRRSPSKVHKSILLKIEERLNELESEAQKEKFKEGLKFAIGSGIIALIIWLFPNPKSD